MKKLLTVAVVLLAVACSGVRAREQVLMKAMKLSWDTSIKSLVNESERATAMSAALESGTRRQVAHVGWEVLRDEALARVQWREDHGVIGPTVAKLLRSEIAEFDRALAKLLER